MAGFGLCALVWSQPHVETLSDALPLEVPDGA